MSGSFVTGGPQRPEPAVVPAPSQTQAQAPAPESSPQHLLGLQQTIGNRAVSRLVVQRAQVDEQEKTVLAGLGDESIVTNAETAIAKMSEAQASVWRAWARSEYADDLAQAYRTLGYVWREKGMPGLENHLSELMPAPPPEVPSREGRPDINTREPGRVRPPVVEPRQRPPEIPVGEWSDLPVQDRVFLELLWKDLGGRPVELEHFKNYWRASPAKLGANWREDVQRPPPDGDPWNWRRSVHGRCQLRIYLSPQAPDAMTVLRDIPEDLIKEGGAKAGKPDASRKYRDAFVIYVSGADLSEAEGLAEKVYDWLRGYQRANPDYFLKEIPAMTRPVPGLRGVSVGEDPRNPLLSFTELREDIVHEALTNAHGNLFRFRSLVLQGLAGHHIPAGAPWKQWSEKQNPRGREAD
jgi:hypothetical protein